MNHIVVHKYMQMRNSFGISFLLLAAHFHRFEIHTEIDKEKQKISAIIAIGMHWRISGLLHEYEVGDLQIKVVSTHD